MDATRAWVDEAIDQCETKGLSYEEIGKTHGRSRTTIYKLMRERGIKRKTPTGRPNGGAIRTEALKPLSSCHSAIGTKLNFDRTVRKNENLSGYGSDLKINRTRLRRMELGVEDFTLSQLMRIAERLGLSLNELLATQPKPTVQHGSHPS